MHDPVSNPDLVDLEGALYSNLTRVLCLSFELGWISLKNDV